MTNKGIDALADIVLYFGKSKCSESVSTVNDIVSELKINSSRSIKDATIILSDYHIPNEDLPKRNGKCIPVVNYRWLIDSRTKKIPLKFEKYLPVATNVEKNQDKLVSDNNSLSFIIHEKSSKRDKNSNRNISENTNSDINRDSNINRNSNTNGAIKKNIVNIGRKINNDNKNKNNENENRNKNNDNDNRDKINNNEDKNKNNNNNNNNNSINDNRNKINNIDNKNKKMNDICNKKKDNDNDNRKKNDDNDNKSKNNKSDKKYSNNNNNNNNANDFRNEKFQAFSKSQQQLDKLGIKIPMGRPQCDTYTPSPSDSFRKSSQSSTIRNEKVNHSSRTSNENPIQSLPPKNKMDVSFKGNYQLYMSSSDDNLFNNELTNDVFNIAMPLHKNESSIKPSEILRSMETIKLEESRESSNHNTTSESIQKKRVNRFPSDEEKKSSSNSSQRPKSIIIEQKLDLQSKKKSVNRNITKFNPKDTSCISTGNNKKTLPEPTFYSSPAKRRKKNIKYVYHIVFTGIHNEMRNYLSLKAKALGIIVRSEFDPIKIDVVVMKSEPSPSDRTLKVLEAITYGKWLVTIDWLYESINKGKILPLHHYEVDVFPGAKKSRILHEKISFPKLTDYSINLSYLPSKDPNSHIYRRWIKVLAEESLSRATADIWLTPINPSRLISHFSPLYPIELNSNEISKLTGDYIVYHYQKKHFIITLNWLFDSISNWEIGDFHSYRQIYVK